MDLFEETTGVLDSWDLLNYPRLNTYIKRNKEIVLDSNLKRFASSSSLLLKKTPYIPGFSNIAAGHYPVCEDTHRNVTSINDKPLIKVTVVPKYPQTAHKRRKQLIKRKAFVNQDHSISSSKNIYLLVPAVPGSKEDKVYAIYTTKLNDKIIKEVNFSNLLSKCIIKSHIIKEMNKNKKKSSEKKKKGEIKPIPECSPDCGYANTMSKPKHARLDISSGSESPQFTARSSYKIVTTAKSSNSISSQQKRTEKNQLRSPDRNSLKDGSKTKSPIRLSRQPTKINCYQMESNGRDGTVRSPDRFSFINNTRSIESVINETIRRSPEKNDGRAPNPGRPGRIRITGRLGLTKDDKCVLDCNATLDDKPIPTQQGAAYAVQPLCIQTWKEECRSPRKQRDSKVQAEDQKQGSGVPCYCQSVVGKESQATQVDFQILCSTSKNTRSNVIQKCACVNTTNVFDLSDDKKETGIALNKHNSPIIIISVYPKNEISTEDTGDLKQQDIKTTVQKKDNKKIGRSRSPSPAKSIKKIGGKKSETRANASSSKKIVRETTKKETRSKDNQSQSKNVVRTTSKTVTKSRTESKTNKGKTTKSQKTPPQSRRSKSPQNTEKTKVTEQIKKALIDDFTKNYTEQINQKNLRLDIPLQSKHNVSNITIDIEGDSDYYNVKLAQNVGKVNTEFRVRKANTGKSKTTAEVVTGEPDTTSLENFLYVKPDNEPRKRSFSQTLMFDGTQLIANNLDTEGMELNVRDSIEISHRREHRASIASKRERDDVSKEVDTEYLAPSKHFPGDDCLVSDPNERDKEIRKLLEIENAVKKDPLRLRSSNTTTLLEKCGQVTFQSNCESFSGTTQTTNSMITLKNIDKNDMEKYLSRTAKTVTLNRPLYQVIWNQNVQLLYQLNWRKRKSIILTRRQYVNVKKTIYYTLIQKHIMLFRPKRYNHDRRLYAGGSVTTETKSIVLHYDKETQTEKDTDALNKQAQADIRSDTYTINDISNCGDASVILSKEEGKLNVNSSNELSGYSSYAKWTQQAIHFDTYMHNVQRTILMAQMKNEPLNKYFKEEYRRKATSVKEIQCQTVSVTRQRVKFSSSDTADYRSRGHTVERNDSCSIHTIFKNHQKSVPLTPNLGTSAYSLQDENSLCLKPRLKFFEDSIDNDPKPKKPLLRRLISCLVFRAFPSSQQKIPTMLKTHGPSSSFDSYHIGTSFGAVEMNSSLYDTTASFYSDHAVEPTTKAKRGFFESFRGFLGRKT